MGTNPTNFHLHIFFLIFLTLTHSINHQTAAATAAAAAAALFDIQSPTSTCNGSIAESNKELEMVMESEISRRFLDEARTQISYKALRKDQPVCNGPPGQAYSAGQCVPRSSNPYHRGCSPTYGCRNSA